MLTLAPFAAPPGWRNQPLTLYHGTLAAHVTDLLKGVRVQTGRALVDFGRGFYTTTVLHQAQTWAIQRALLQPGMQSAVLGLELDREQLARLNCLWFVLGDREADDFWSLVYHCRGGGQAHLRKTKLGWYDAVVGPVTADWRQKLLLADTDQISFHTPRAERLLNQSRRWRVL